MSCQGASIYKHHVTGIYIISRHDSDAEWWNGHSEQRPSTVQCY